MIFFFILSCVTSKVSEKKTENSDLRQSFLEPIDGCGSVLDTHHGVSVMSNGGGVSSCDGERNLDSDGYSYGIKWQCVEFVRRYYKDYLKHSMPNRYGNAVDYFRTSVGHGQRNKERNLIQYYNGKSEKPRADDLLVFPNMADGLGHVAIVKLVTDTEITLIQQNAFPTTQTISLTKSGKNWTIEEDCIGFLRMR